MGRKALSDVPKLKTITIPNTFEYDGSDTSYTIFDGVQGPFSYSNIETVVFEDGIEQIPDGICYNNGKEMLCYGVQQRHENYLLEYIIKSCICLLYYMSLIVNFSVSARFNYVSSERW